MRKGRDREKKTEKKTGKKTDENSGHYIIASSRPPERQPPERRLLAPIEYSGRSPFHKCENISISLMWPHLCSQT